MDPHEYETHEIRSSDKQPITVSSQLMDTQQKYHVTLQSGRDFILNSGYDVYVAAWEAYEEAALMDDYLVNVEPIE